MNKTKLVHQSTIWCMCVRACVYALFAIVSRIIWKYRHVSISRWKCVPISLFSRLPYVFSHILAYRRVKIQFYINMLLSPCTKTVRRKESINALTNSNTHISLASERHFPWFRFVSCCFCSGKSVRLYLMPFSHDLNAKVVQSYRIITDEYAIANITTNFPIFSPFYG